MRGQTERLKGDRQQELLSRDYIPSPCSSRHVIFSGVGVFPSNPLSVRFSVKSRHMCIWGMGREEWETILLTNIFERYLFFASSQQKSLKTFCIPQLISHLSPVNYPIP